jgi:hypothetical protein
VPTKARGWSALCATAMLAAAGASPAAAADRGIELLSTGGNEAADVQLAMPAADGGSALLQSRGSYWGAEPDGAGSPDDLWWSRRGPTGWSFELATPNTPRGQATQPLRMAPDGSAIIVASAEQLDPAADTDAALDLYRWENGTYTLLTAPEAAAGTDSALGIEKSVWVSPDMRRIIFSTKSRLLAADQSAGRDIYQLLDGNLSLISVDDAGSTTAAGDSQLSLGGAAGFSVAVVALVRNMVSADESTVFFVTNRKLDPGDTDNAQNDVYARIGNDTILVSDVTSDPAVVDPAGHADFAGASADGTKACFTTPQKLSGDTDNANDLYCRSVADPATLTRVSVGALPATGNLNAANGHAIAVGLTDNAARMFFITREKLTSDAPATGTPAIYVNEGGVTTLVSALTAADAGTGAGSLLGQEPLRPFRMSPDGSTAVFTTSAQARPDIVDADNATDVYRWKNGTLELLTAGVTLPATLSTGFGGALQETPFAISTADLSRIFFSTAQPLVGEDTDSSLDVYEHSADGVELVSVGGGEGDVRSAGISADGQDVYLHSYAALLPQDDDYGQQDVYIAKAGSSGFPSSAPASDGGGGSAGPGGGGGALPGLPSVPTPTSGTSTPGADAPPAHSGSSGGGSPVGPTTPFAATVAAVKGNSAVRLVLQPPSAGQVEVEVTARIGGKRVRIGRASRAVVAGETSLRVGLSRSARRQLRKAGVLKAAVRVRFVPTSGSPTTEHLAITLRSPESKR